MSDSSIRQAGQDADFSDYFDRRVDSVRFTAYLLCGDWHEAEDLTQAAFLKLYLAWHRLSRGPGLDAYTRRVVVRTFLADRRRLWRKREHLTDSPPEPGLGDAQPEDRLVLWQALSAVAPKQRAVLVLRYWNDLSVEDTAAALKCSPGTVKSQSAKGLATLRQRLGDRYPERIPLDQEGA
ncbi:SigE family RNA polymerase sigma factor [Solihabitans fulvus]|uniref:SigE family RNA polymerase sigma factor n=1 Tax=Solihabitans fulvus TaxID=1892852 RepID=A0A5B2XEJ8_9PSEU|nr:SigE family RNA polymerase sigma factor [Solihabitans fulvus]KAA2261666.1 SigE family RNA polymerase sigma factor [Solihabitans fulvus]